MGWKSFFFLQYMKEGVRPTDLVTLAVEKEDEEEEDAEQEEPRGVALESKKDLEAHQVWDR